jgi:two-component system LytT family response regulator
MSKLKTSGFWPFKNIKVPVKELNLHLFSNPDLIIYCMAEGNYTQIHLIDKCLLESKTLKQIEALLPKETFIRIHRSFLINLT